MDRLPDLASAFSRSRPLRANDQKALGSPACFRMPLAVCLERIFESTGNLRLVIGLYQISWSPLPCRSKLQPRCFRSLLISVE